jgi:hypothetical protein
MKRSSKNTPVVQRLDAANDEPSLLEVAKVIESPTLMLAIFAAETLGIEVLPLKTKDKVPATTHGCKDSSRDLTQIRKWFEKGDYNIGFATGSKSKVFALDVDVGEGKYGEDSLAELQAQYGKLPDTVETMTGNGGKHLYFNYPSDVEIPCSAGKLGVNLDVRGENGYCVAPTSSLANGGIYEFEGSSDPLEGVEIAEAPQWLIGLVKRDTRAVLRQSASGAYESTEWECFGDTQRADILEALSVCSNEGYDNWTHRGMEIHSFDPTENGYKLWCEWAAKDYPTEAQAALCTDEAGRQRFYSEKQQAIKWLSFSNSKTEKRQLGSLMQAARKTGWKPKSELELLAKKEQEGLAVADKINNPSIDVHSIEFNQTLDTEKNHFKLNLLKHIDDTHLAKRLSLSISEAMHLPSSSVLLCLLGVFSSMTCRAWRVKYQDDGDLPIGMYTGIEQPSGTSKSRCLNILESPFVKALKKHRAKCLEEAKGIEDREERKQKELLASITYISTNPTPEGLENTLLTTRGAFSCLSAEQGMLNSLLGISYGDSKKANNNDLVLHGFNGEYMSSKRIGREGFNGEVYGSVVAFAQNGFVEKLLNESDGSGYAERFLMASEDHNLGKRDHLNVKRINKDYLDEYTRICDSFSTEAFENPKWYDELTELSIDNEGWTAIQTFKNKIEPFLKDGCRYSHVALRGAANKVDMQVMKISANLHILKGFKLVPYTIGNDCVNSAIGIVADLLESNLSMLKNKEVVGSKAEYSAIISYLSKKPTGAPARDIINAMRNTNPFKDFTGGKSDLVKKAINEMVEQKILIVDAATIDGIPKYKIR